MMTAKQAAFDAIYPQSMQQSVMKNTANAFAPGVDISVTQRAAGQYTCVVTVMVCCDSVL